MKLLSVNVGLPRLVMHKDNPVSTGIFKEPVSRRLKLGTLNLDGDRQADLSVHGGPSKAVYVYPSEHYVFWRQELPDMELPWGMFGENFTTSGLAEGELNIGDKFSVGSALVMITEPRMPCFKLGIRFGRSDIIKRFLVSGRTGFYFAVLREGEIGAGDPIELVERDKKGVRVSDVTRLYTSEKHNVELLRRVIQVDALPESWRGYFQNQLKKLMSS
ncbi:MAG: MOSC domain-containing protein [Pyrinomonadaceae bacterium]